MSVQSAILIGVAASGLALSGCHPARIGEHRNERPLTALARLDCPERQGDLERTAATGDGRSCTYAGDQGQEVTLQLTALDGRTPQAILADLDTQLKQEVGAGEWTASGDRQDLQGDATANAVASSDADAASDESNGRGEHTHIDLPGFHIDADGDRARVSLPGVHVNANGGRAEVNIDKPGGRLVSVHADEQGAEVRTGEITARTVNASYLLASKTPGQDGERAVGYVARGPVGGPLVIGRVKSRNDRSASHNLMGDVHHLVDRNVRAS